MTTHTSARLACAGRILALAGMLGLTPPVLAHNPMASCKQLADGMIQCKGGFSNGIGAPGVTFDVISYDEQILLSGQLDQHSSIRFARPDQDFYVLLDAGPGHVFEIDHTEILP